MEYNFGIPSFIIHLGHLLIGTFLIYIGYYQKINKQTGMILVVLGSLAIVYHGHLLILDYTYVPFQPPVSNHSLPFQNQQTKSELEQAIQLNSLQR